jgi:hypothetical protein
MKVIVSTENLSLEGYTVVKSYRELLNWKLSDIEFVILHSSEEDDTNTMLNLSNLQTNGVKTVAYISKSPSPIIKLSIQSTGGLCVEDEFYLEDVDELEYFISEIDLSTDTNTNTSDLDSCISIVSDFIKDFVNKDSKLKTPVYLATVDRAVQSIAHQNVLANEQVQQVGLSAINIFSNLSGVLSAMKDSSDVFKQKLAELEAQVNQHTSQPRFGFQQMFLFPPYTYVGIAKILNICEVSPCRYLTSFLLAYQEYLKVKQNKRVKFILLHQKNKRSAIKYKDMFTQISTETFHREDLLKAERVVTDVPKEEVLKALFTQNDEVFIVLDRMYSEPMLRGKVKTLYAINGVSDIRKFKLRQELVLASDSSTTGIFSSIPYIDLFDVTGGSSVASYFQHCTEQFKKLDKFLELEMI